MLIKVLGSGAGGGFPQWNCSCSNCAAVRAGKPGFTARKLWTAIEKNQDIES